MIATFEENIKSEIFSDQFAYALRQAEIEPIEYDVTKSEYVNAYHATMRLDKYGTFLNVDRIILEDLGFKFLAMGGLSETLMFEFLVIA